MGAVVSCELQGDLGVLAMNSIRYAIEKSDKALSTSTIVAVSRIVPLLDEKDIRLLMLEVERAYTADKSDHCGWFDLMTVMRRIDRP